MVSTPEKFVATILAATVAAVAATLLAWLANRLADLVGRGLNRLLLGLGTVRPLRRFVVGAYLRRVRQTHGSVHNIYLEREDRLDLHQVFVPLRLLGRGAGALIGAGAAQDTRTVLTAPGHQRLAILGAPGSGKTTLLKSLASGVSQRQWVEFRRAVPVSARLRLYAQDDDRTALWDWLATRLAEDYGLRRADGLLTALARDGLLLVLLDGLDEVGEAAAGWMPMRIGELHERLAGLGASRLLVTCREQNFDLLPDAGLFGRHRFGVYRLAELRDGEMEALIARRGPDFQAKGKSAVDFLAQVRAAPAVLDLHRNPLLLTLSIGLYLNRAEDLVPHDLAGFYGQGIDNLLRRHDFATAAERRLGLRPRNRCSHRDKLALLQRFALARLRAATADRQAFEVWLVADLIADAKALAGERLGIAPEQARTLVDECHRHAGIITDTGDGTHFCFAHRSLHEFCAAAELAQRPDGLALALAHADEPDWAQVLIFYASLPQAQAEALVTALLERARTGPTARLVLAGQSAAVLAQPLTALRHRVARALADALRGPMAATPTGGGVDAGVDAGADAGLDAGANRGVAAGVDRGAERALLAALIRLGRNAAGPVRADVDRTLRRLLDTDQPERLADEIGRFDPASALGILDFLIDSGEPARLRAALIGLRALDGIERLPLLWRLLGLFASHADLRAELAETAGLLLCMLDDPAAVERFAVQPALPPGLVSEALTRMVWPFTPDGERPGNLAMLLGMVATWSWPQESPDTAMRRMSTDSDVNQTWRKLADCALEHPRVAMTNFQAWGGWRWRLWHHRLWRLRQPHRRASLDRRDWRDWLRLPAARERRTWRVSWRALAWVVIASAIGFGCYWCATVLVSAGFRFNSPDDWLGLTALAGAIALATAVLWWPWDWLARRIGWTSAAGGAYPTAVKGVLLPTGLPPAAHLSLTVRVRRTLLRLLGRALLWMPIILLPPLALFLTHLVVSGHIGSVVGVAYHPNGILVATASWDETAHLWRAKTGAEVRRFVGHRNTLTSVAFSPDGRHVLTGSVDNTARSWNIDTGAEVRRFAGRTDTVTSVAFSPDGSRVLTGSYDDTARLWDADTGAEVRRFTGHQPNVTSVAFSRDGHRVLTGSDDRTARLWDADTGAEVQRFEGHEHQVWSVAFSPDGRRVLTGSRDSTARLWDADTGAEVRRFAGHEADVTSVAFSADGHRVLTGSWDNTARLWEADIGAEVQRFEGHEAPVWSVAFSPDGHRVLTGSWDGSARLWDADTGALIWATPIPFYNESTWNAWDLVVFALLVVLLVYVPTLKWFDPGRWLYLRRPNRYLWLYDLPGIGHYLPPGPGADRRTGRGADRRTEGPHQSERRHPVGTGSADFQSAGREDNSA